MADTYSYSVRVVEYKGEQQAYKRHIAHNDDLHFMRSMGWELVYSTHSLDHTASLYRRPAPVNSVDIYASQVANSPDPT